MTPTNGSGEWRDDAATALAAKDPAGHMDVDQLARATCLILCSNNRIYVSMKISVDVMEAAADRASDLLKALANRHRLLIICQLIDGERSVGDLAEFLGLRN